MNREIRLARYPDGTPVPADFTIAEADVAAPLPGEVAVAVEYLSMDPVVRTRMTAAPAMGPPLPLSSVVPGRGVGRVIAGAGSGLATGTLVYGEFGWRSVAILSADDVTVLPPSNAPVHHHLNALGPTGLAAYFVTESLFLRAGDTLFIAPGAGAVGSIAAQIARHFGARVIATGIGPAQQAHLRRLGVEAVDPDAPIETGIDAFIDGVGGALHDRVIARLNPQARVVLLGFLSDYATAGPPRYGSMGPILMKRATVSGFLLADHMARADQARSRLASFIADGVVTPVETIWDGLDQAPKAFAALFDTAGPGKQLVKLG